jgi:hypothetical protein
MSLCYRTKRTTDALLNVGLPPTKERYIAEVRNLLAFRLGFRVCGRPRATASELQRALGGVRMGTHTVFIGSTVVTVRTNCTTLERV